MLTFKQKLTLVGFSLGIFASFTIFGLVEEQIFRKKYGNETDSDNGEMFRLVYSFDLMQSISFAIIAKILLVATGQPECESSQIYFAFAAFFCVMSKVTTRFALGWVSYITQIIGKSCKPVPVMILGFLIAHKKYNFKKVIFVISIIIGVIIFNYNQKKDSKKTESDNLLWGNLMIAASLLFDGLLGATEDKMRAISKPSALNFMYYLNLWSIGFGLLGVLAFNEAPKFIDFTTRHPEIIKYFPLAILIGAIGQLFISSMLSNFGPLPLSLTTTVRKFFSVILSVIVHNNSLQWQQWGAAAIIFGALFTDAIMNKKKANSSSNDNEVVKNNIETVNELEKLDKNETKVVEINGELSKNEILKIT